MSMKKSLILMLALLLVAGVAMAQEKKIERKVIVKDGKVWTSENGGPLVARESFFRGGFLGVQTLNLNPELRQHFGAPKEAGVLVSEVSADSPAAKAGLRVGDIITSIDDQNVENRFELRRVIAKKKANDTVKIGFLRNGVRQVAHASIVEGQRTVVDVETLVDPVVIQGISAEAIGDVTTYFSSPEWKARMEQLRDCSKVQTKIDELEKRLREMDQKLKK
jgi:membrane-associated protease RseP (regulator of RpoE activity)